MSRANGFRVPERALVVFAHPDDAEFGCSGTVAAFTARGCRVAYCVLTNGNKGTHDLKMPPDGLAEMRRKEQRDAADELKVAEVIFLDHDDGELEPTMALRGEVCRVIREQRPDLVFAQDPWRRYQMHPDHRVAGWAGLDGVIAARDHLFFPEQLSGTLEHHRVKRVLLFGTSEPNLWFDIAATLDVKVRALQRHRSQLRRPREVLSRIRQWAAAQGRPWGLGPAEGFRYIELG